MLEKINHKIADLNQVYEFALLNNDLEMVEEIAAQLEILEWVKTEVLQ